MYLSGWILGLFRAWYNRRMAIIESIIKSKRSSIDYGVILTITLLAFGLRAPFVESRSLTIDEASSLKWVDGHSLVYLLTHYHTNSHQLVSLMTRVIDPFGHWLTFYRGPSLVFGVLTVPLLYQLGRRMLGQKAGLLAALLLAIAPFHVDFSIQMRGYAPATFWAALFYYCVWQGLSKSKRRYWIALAMASILAVYAHLFAALAVGAGWVIIGAAFLRFVFQRGALPPWTKSALLGLLLTATGITLLYGPILPRLIATPAAEKNWPSQIEPLFAAGAFNNRALQDYLKVFRLYGPLGEPRSWLVWGFVLLAAFGAVSALARPKTRHSGEAMLIWIFLPILGVILGLQFVEGFYAYRRFFIFFQPLYLLLMAYGMLTLSWLAGKWSKQPAAAHALLGLLLLAAMGAAGWKLYRQTAEDTDNRWYLAAKPILASGPNSLVVCEPFGDRMKERAAHRDECYRNLEFYLGRSLGDTPPYLRREIDQFAAIPALSEIPELAEETGSTWVLLWQHQWPAQNIVLPSAGAEEKQTIIRHKAGSTVILQAPSASHLVGLARLSNLLAQLDTTPEDHFSYLLSQAQMQAILGRPDSARQTLLAAQELLPAGIDAENRLKSVADLIGVSLGE